MFAFAIRIALSLMAFAALTGCLRYNVDNSVSHARLGEIAVIDKSSIAPIEIIEDSRCPEGVYCIWPGRLVISARVSDRSGEDLRELTLGETFRSGGREIEFFSARPKAEKDIAPLLEDYRFGFRLVED